MSRKGFTLVELLVVAAIIALLIGILAPALGSARHAARNVVCLNQMKQTMTASLMYAQDHRDLWPRSTHSALARGVMPWGYALCPYLGRPIYTAPDPPWWKELRQGFYRCPADTRRDSSWSYGKNVWFELTSGETGELAGQAAGPVFPKVLDTPRPSATLFYGELASGSTADHIMAHFWLMGGKPEVASTRHGSTSNYAYVDGHVTNRAFTQTFNLTLNQNQWNPASAQ